MSFNLRNAPAYALVGAEQKLNLRNAPVYALLKDGPGISARRVSAFALEQVNPQFDVRTLTVFALEAVVPPSLFTSMNGLETLRAAIKKELGVTVNDALASFGDPQVNAGGYNTRVILTANPNADYSGTAAIQYTRWPIEDAFKGKNTSQVIGAATSIHGRLAAINTFFGLKLEPRDVVDKVLVPDTPGFTLRIASTSYLYLPNTTIAIGVVNGSDLSIEIEVGELNGFEEITDLDAWIKVSEMKGFEPAT